MDKGDDPYNILGLSPYEVAEDPNCIKRNYRKLARIHHPDKVSGDRKETADRLFAKISHAYEILQDEGSRRSYDLSQRHSNQQGYDPDGPTYYEQSSVNNDGGQNRAPKTNTPSATRTTTTTSRRTVFPSSSSSATRTQKPPHFSYQEPCGSNDIFVCRTASSTVTDKSSGKLKTFSYTKTSDGITRVDVQSYDGGTSSYSVSLLDGDKHNEVYQQFKDQFGRDAADDFFFHDTSGKTKKKKKSTKSKSKSKTKPNDETKNIDRSSSPTGVATQLYKNQPPYMGFIKNASKPKKEKSKIVPEESPSITTHSNKNYGSTSTCNSIDMMEDGVQSMSMKERIVINPKTNRKELLSTTTLTRFDGSIETRIERRPL